MGIHLTFVSLETIANGGKGTPASAVRAALAKLGIVLPPLHDGNHDFYLANTEWSSPQVSEDASISIVGDYVPHISIFRPCSPGIRELCYELLVSGFAMFEGETQFATPEALDSFPVLRDQRKFLRPFIPIGGPGDFPWVTYSAMRSPRSGE